MSFFTEVEKSILKFTWKHKRPWIAKVILSKKSNAWGIIPDFKFYCRAIGTKIEWWGQKTNKQKNTDQWNRIEDLEIKPDSYSYLISDKGSKKHTLEKRQPQQILLRKLVICMTKTETCTPISHHVQKSTPDGWKI
jgi:hypothetical protein